MADEQGRERLLDMSPRVRTLRNLTFVLQLVVLLGCAPWLGWWTPAPMIAVAVVFAVCDRRMSQVARPEIPYAVAWVGTLVAITVGALITGGPHAPCVIWFALAVSSLPGRFTTRGIVAGVALALVLLAGVTVGYAPTAVWHHPSTVLFPAMLIVGVALFGWAHMHSEVAQRAEAVMDPLTQMLNRKALVSRAAELAQQTRLTRKPVGVVLGDLDHFKDVNDSAGHQVGDAVLRDVAFRWRLSLRAYEMAYRLGGEEFLVLLPGATLAEAEEVAERLRGSVGAAPIAGQAVTMSFGVAASADGEPFDFDELYARADVALYRAKRGGRDRVCGGPAESDPPIATLTSLEAAA
ncbi:GGDEF domain-containing protein [Baekduia alba]|uniref:GGDEF domain-containing protein n=1 Tax=Baekduia alba TaxID=2997333 RepID=UPI0023417EEB|nr:GGDEF domain-containing protein [Baekduia alba]